ncbi:MAG: dihydrolipoyl dehydrogenase [Alcaligenaceae bacterium]|nr:dihydrolipoyl dehydrogenase [Alcaligenaceae bacterium]
MRDYVADIAIIGAGTAGMGAYRVAKASGQRVVLIEGGPYGTTCARVGCMPSKLLIAAAEAAHHARHTTPFGVHVDGAVRVDGAQVMARVKSERDRFVGFVLESIEGFDPADRIRGYARFLDDTTLQVDDHTRVSASRIIIATGSSPVVPDMYRSLGDRVVINDDVFEWDNLPERVLVVGPGVIGLELGQALSRLGVEVTVVGRSEGLAGISDPLVRQQALAAFRDEFPVHLRADVVAVRRKGQEVEVDLSTPQGESTLRFDYVLLSVGRSPNLHELGLEHTSMRFDERNMPVFSRQTLQIEGVPIFLAGDVNAQWPLLHEAADDGRIAAENAVSYPAVTPARRRAPMSVVFTDPQVMSAGQRYAQLDENSIVVGAVDFSGQGRSRVMLKNRGMLRVYADKSSGRFLGAEMVGPAAEHIAHLLAWSYQQGLTIAQMLDMPFYHPVIEEGLRTALRDAAAQLQP